MGFQGHRLRHGRYTEAYRPYLLTSVTHERHRFLAGFTPGAELCRLFEHYDHIGWCNNWAWVVMPDHIHWLVSPEPGTTLAQLMRNFKAFSARKLNQVQNCKGRRVWQRGYHDHAVRKEEDLHATARYIIANPVRAGLVDSVRDYPFWNACWL